MNSINWKRTGTAMMLVAGLCALLTGCSSSPSARDGERAIRNRINEQSQGRVKLTKFEKSNGAQGELMGFKIYALEFDAEIEFTEDCKWITGMFGQQLSFQTSKPVAKPNSGFSWNSFLDDTTNPGTLVRKGQRVKLSGVVRFVKKEKGWSVDGVELSKADVGSTPQPSQKTARKDSPEPTDAVSLECFNQLKMVGIAFSIWAQDHNGQFPFNVSTNETHEGLVLYNTSGVMELCLRGDDGFDKNSHIIFQALANELSTPKLLVCPADSTKRQTSSLFFSRLKPLLPVNVSYQVRSGPNVDKSHPEEILVRCPIHGHILRCDGSLQSGESQAARALR